MKIIRLFAVSVAVIVALFAVPAAAQCEDISACSSQLAEGSGQALSARIKLTSIARETIAALPTRTPRPTVTPLPTPLGVPTVETAAPAPIAAPIIVTVVQIQTVVVAAPVTDTETAPTSSRERTKQSIPFAERLQIVVEKYFFIFLGFGVSMLAVLIMIFIRSELIKRGL